MNRRMRWELATLLGLGTLALTIRDLARNRRNVSWSSMRQSLHPLTLALGGTALGLAAIPSRPYSYRGKSAVITGGSRGLGLTLARLLLEEGANVTILARDPEELNRARSDLERISPQILDLVCDVTETEHFDNALAEARARFGRIDLLINNAGAIAIGPFDTLDNDDFRAQFDVHVRSIVESLRLIRPYFRMNNGGRVINISSIGGKVPMPHMAAYCASKFAVAGFSESVAAELRAENIKITTAFPGLMRTGSPKQAVFKGDASREYSWFAISDNTPGLSMSAERAARKILEASRKGQSEIVVSLPAKLGSIAHELLPETFASAMALVAQLLPQSRSRDRRTGAAVGAFLSRIAWLSPIQRIKEDAEVSYNQKSKFDAEANMGITGHPYSP